MKPHFLRFDSFQRVYFLIAVTGFLHGCAKEPNQKYHHQSGEAAQIVRCPVGEYEQCLMQMSEACREGGYTVQEKIRQVKLGIWSDVAETLIVAKCNNQ